MWEETGFWCLASSEELMSRLPRTRASSKGEVVEREGEKKMGWCGRRAADIRGRYL